jgi:hypothetical protein
MKSDVERQQQIARAIADLHVINGLWALPRKRGQLVLGFTTKIRKADDTRSLESYERRRAALA